jgi:hypothetical protein
MVEDSRLATWMPAAAPVSKRSRARGAAEDLDEASDAKFSVK